MWHWLMAVWVQLAAPKEGQRTPFGRDSHQRLKPASRLNLSRRVRARLRSPLLYPLSYGPARKDRQVDSITPGPTGGAGTGAAGRPGDRALRPARRARPPQIRVGGSAG